ncbi:MAG: phosphoglucosamine mutase [Lachnospiraceae bacterium]|nr:phosphoglucosamine mutase [Lachnospiraceae bacterium]
MKYFGTDGFRGRVNETLTVDHAIKIGKFLGYYFSNTLGNVRCVIGKDTRKSGYMYEYGLVAGLTSTGVDVSLLHVTTTPSISYITRTEKFDFGIMITASHNPYYDNGIKVIDRDGFKMSDKILELVEEYIDGKVEIELAKNEKIGRASDYIQGRNKYISYLAQIPTHSFRGYKVGLDCANGASFMIAKNVFDMLGAETFVINNQPDGLNINRDCGSTHIESLQKLVKEKGLDIGFAFDGDSDRCLAVDENGEIVDGDMIIYIYGCYLKERTQLVKDTVVTTVMSNIGLTKALNAKGIKNVQTPVGDKYVSAEIQAEGYSVGGEQSGHVIFNKYATTGDGILTAIKVLEICIEKKCTLSSLVSDVTIFPQLLINVRVEKMEEVLERPELKETTDGILAKLGDTGRIVLRKSGTEPLVRIMVEAQTDEECEKYCNEIKDKVLELSDMLK